jgi:hypothetical protein
LKEFWKNAIMFLLLNQPPIRLAEDPHFQNFISGLGPIREGLFKLAKGVAAELYQNSWLRWPVFRLASTVGQVQGSNDPLDSSPAVDLTEPFVFAQLFSGKPTSFVRVACIS